MYGFLTKTQGAVLASLTVSSLATGLVARLVGTAAGLKPTVGAGSISAEWGVAYIRLIWIASALALLVASGWTIVARRRYKGRFDAKKASVAVTGTSPRWSTKKMPILGTGFFRAKNEKVAVTGRYEHLENEHEMEADWVGSREDASRSQADALIPRSTPGSVSSRGPSPVGAVGVGEASHGAGRYPVKNIEAGLAYEPMRHRNVL